MASMWLECFPCGQFYAVSGSSVCIDASEDAIDLKLQPGQIFFFISLIESTSDIAHITPRTFLLLFQHTMKINMNALCVTGLN